MRRGVLASVIVASIVTLSPLALGAGKGGKADKSDKELAKQAYDRGLEAHKRGDKKTAAEEFARADALAPSPIALQAALDAAIEADDAALGAELLERSKRAPAPPALASSVTAAHLKFNGRAGRVLVKCPSGSTCTAKIDDRPIDTDRVAFATIGQHKVTVQVDGRTGPPKLVDVTADEIVQVAPGGKEGATAAADDPSSTSESETSWPSDEQPPARHRESNKRLPPVVFYGGVGLTVLLAGATTIFAVKTASAHGDFTDAGCDRANADPCTTLQADGQSSQTLTNVFFVSTLVAGAATAVVGAFFTDWSAPVFGADRNGATVGWRVRF